MPITDYDIVNPLGGSATNYSTLDQRAISRDGSLFNDYHPILADGGNFLRLGPDVPDINDATFYLAKSIPSGSTEAVDTSIIVSGGYIDNGLPIYLLHRWAEGVSPVGIRFGFSSASYLVLDINRAMDGYQDSGGYAIRLTLSGVWRVGFHGLRLVTRTLGVDVYMTAYAHFNMPSLAALSWTKLFTALHVSGSSAILHAQFFSEAPVTSLQVGNTNGLTSPCTVGRSGLVLSGGSVARYGYGKNFVASLGNGGLP